MDKVKKQEWMKVYRAKNKDKIKEYNALYRVKNREDLRKKSLEYYYKNKDKFLIYCNDNKGKWEVKNKSDSKELYRKYNLKRKYDITEDDYNNLLINQDYKCAICKIPENTFLKRKHLHVDHCHTTGKIRGLLCSNCNTSLGLLKDSIETVNNMLNYLNTNL